MLSASCAVKEQYNEWGVRLVREGSGAGRAAMGAAP